ncbi:uncharacterized protein LOC113749566 [Coffea eugenioides]|uniref:uncharacterized protein LOC113749566 n=1 Tax=Coffea eugenioides TaxID=49369 RepID=UPI000F60A6BF|nr:uncharacterized protein LOC113749566 [Coffea eugenioides]
MHQRSSIRLCKLIFRHPFRPSSKPMSTFSKNPFTSPANQCSLHSFSLLNPKINPFFLQSLSSSSSTQLKKFQSLRLYSAETDKEVDTINIKFAEAREEIESAMESKETVYFDDEAECARAAVKEVLDLYEGLLRKLPENEKAAIQRSMGLKIEQLKAELEQLNE